MNLLVCLWTVDNVYCGEILKYNHIGLVIYLSESGKGLGYTLQRRFRGKLFLFDSCFF